MLKLVSIEILQPQLVKLKQFVSVPVPLFLTGTGTEPPPPSTPLYETMCMYVHVAFIVSLTF